MAKLASLEEELKNLRLRDVKSTQVVMAEVWGCCGETGHGGHECPRYMEPLRRGILTAVEAVVSRCSQLVLRHLKFRFNGRLQRQQLRGQRLTIDIYRNLEHHADWTFDLRCANTLIIGESPATLNPTVCREGGTLVGFQSPKFPR
ncbi:E3 ubiquitin-protein ligase XIAP [Striga asiatica]|uniref:E3 ubiquitin-protein ligase XIAP n=1 Tax=Striga asiatica TaxID=4170 RepID=A0A5A7PA65_STRAF|nr:E3 ubiquitin-protein ligase XIAP [Striga asiatica]